MAEHHHRNIQGGGARAAVFGISDGLVSNVSLVLGVSGAHPAASFVRLAGLAGLVGDTPEVLAGVLVVIAVVALVRHDSVVAFVTLPLLVTAVLVGSVIRGRARA